MGNRGHMFCLSVCAAQYLQAHVFSNKVFLRKQCVGRPRKVSLIFVSILFGSLLKDMPALWFCICLEGVTFVRLGKNNFLWRLKIKFPAQIMLDWFSIWQLAARCAGRVVFYLSSGPCIISSPEVFLTAGKSSSGQVMLDFCWFCDLGFAGVVV